MKSSKAFIVFAKIFRFLQGIFIAIGIFATMVTIGNQIPIVAMKIHSGDDLYNAGFIIIFILLSGFFTTNIKH